MNKSSSTRSRIPGIVCFVLILIFTSACNNHSDSESKQQVLEKTGQAESNTTQVPKPKIDIHTAVISNDIETVNQHILAGTDINQKEPFAGSSPLINAGVFGHKKMAELLINSGADLNLKNNDGATALHTSAFFGRPEIVKLLLENGAINGVKDKNGSTPYDSVAGPFQHVKPFYDMLGQALAPMGLKLDYEQLKTVRPIIATMLK